MDKKNIIYIFLLVAILAALLTLVLRTEVQAEENVTETTIETTENVTEEPTTVTETTTEAEPTTVKFEDLPEYEELGTYKLTAYCACSKCCGKSDGITASGTKATAGRTVAAKNIPFGTQLMINGNTYTVEDRGGFGSNTIDVYMDSHSAALNFGVKYAKVYEVIG